MATHVFSTERVEDAADSAGLDRNNLHLNYSGRGMFGRSCVGVVGSLRDVVAFLYELFDQDMEAVLDNIDGGRDSMGYDTIYYWSNITAYVAPEIQL